MSRKSTRVSKIGLLTLIFWLLFAPFRPVFAHGAGRVLQLSGVVAGPFHLTAWSAPGILRPGEIHVVTAVTSASVGAQDVPRVDVLVQVSLSPVDRVFDTTLATTPETRGEKVTRLAYPLAEVQGIQQEAAFVVEQSGTYEVEIVIAGAEGASGTATFLIEVVEIPNWIKSFIYMQLAVAALAVLWMLKEGRRIWTGGQVARQVDQVDLDETRAQVQNIGTKDDK